MHGNYRRAQGLLLIFSMWIRVPYSGISQVIRRLNVSAHLTKVMLKDFLVLCKVSRQSTK